MMILRNLNIYFFVGWVFSRVLDRDDISLWFLNSFLFLLLISWKFVKYRELLLDSLIVKFYIDFLILLFV